MSKLLFEIENYRGEGIAAALFYEAKVTEAIALVVDCQKKQAAKNAHPLSREDISGLENVMRYIADHYAPCQHRLYERKQIKKLFQTAYRLYRYCIYSRAAHEPGRASSH